MKYYERFEFDKNDLPSELIKNQVRWFFCNRCKKPFKATYYQLLPDPMGLGKFFTCPICKGLLTMKE